MAMVAYTNTTYSTRDLKLDLRSNVVLSYSFIALSDGLSLSMFGF